MLVYLLIFLTALASTLLLTPVVRSFALKIGAVDAPGTRKIHKSPIPRLGGLAIYAGFMISALPAVSYALSSGMKLNYHGIYGVIIGASIMMMVGLIDDVFGLSSWVKLSFQLIAASIAVYFGVSISFVSNPFNGLLLLGVFSLPVTVLWLVGITNAMNLIDGLDGLASGIAAIASIALFLVALRTHQVGSAMIFLSLAGASAGFLRYNFNPASIFLGDSGSLFVGFVIAAASVLGVLKSTLVIAFIIPVLVLGVPIFDTLSAIVRRLKTKAHIFQADGAHIHHRLLLAGFTQREAVMSIYFICILLSFGALVVSFMNAVESLLLLLLIFPVAVFGFLRIRQNINIRVSGGRA